MADWYAPQLEVSGNDISVVIPSGDVSLDVSTVDSSSDVSDIYDHIEEVDDAASEFVSDVSGDDPVVSMDFETFKSLFSSLQTVSEGDVASDQALDEALSEDVILLAEQRDVATGAFTPQAWQLNIAENRPIGTHYVMSRLANSNNHYYIIVGRDISYSSGIYTYDDCMYYDYYSYSSGGTTRYEYSVNDAASGSVSGSSYIVYSDLFFDYTGGRTFDFSFLIVLLLLLSFLVFLFIKGGNRN